MTRIHLLVITLLLVSSTLSERSTVVTSRREKDKGKYKIGNKINNPCSVDSRNAPIHCYCSPNGIPANATSAECWIFSNDVVGEYHYWGYFVNQPYIKEMKIQVRPDGRLATIPTKALAVLQELQKFTVMYGNVEKIHSFAFANSSKLMELNLAKNQIITLEEMAFAHLPNLTEVILDENRISELNRNVFVNVPNLQRLYITQNNLSVIEEDAFKYMASLIELELQYNYLTTLTKETFTGLSGLEKLELGHNKINFLGDLTFAELWDLEILNLEENQIEYISPRAFVGLNHLKRLTLNENKLRMLSTNVLDALPGINYLDLRSNDLETLTYENIKPILHNLRNSTSYFQIEYNKLKCDCRLEWLHKFFNETKSESIRNGLDRVKCIIEETSSTTTPKSANNNAIFHNEAEEDWSTSDVNQDLNSNDADYNYNDPELHQSDQRSKSTSSPVYPHSLKLKHFFQIPIHELPCPEKEHATESPQTFIQTPAYAEINFGGSSYSTGASNPLRNLISTTLTCLGILISLT